MIHYQLRCGKDHSFDGWFRDSAAFDSQAKAGLVECPDCADTHVTRALMAPALSRKGMAKRAPEQEAPSAAVPAPASPPAAAESAPAGEPGPMAVAGPRMPDQMRAALQRMRAEVERRCTYVGPQFAEEARKIHRGESRTAGIYGEATPAEAEALADEGIEVGRIPWVPRADG